MASCICHVLGGTKRLRLERIVRPLLDDVDVLAVRADDYLRGLILVRGVGYAQD